jgi:beta-lactamase superfamily II metal-dependent hydrolase
MAVTIPARRLFFFFDITVTSAIARFGLALPMVVYFHRVGFSGLSANALVVPLMGVALPVSFVAVLTGSAWVAAAAAWLLRISQSIVTWHAAMEPTGDTPASPTWNLVCEKAAKVGVKIAPLQEGRQLLFGGAQIDVLVPPADYIPADTPKNNDSLVLRLRYGRHAFLLSGDVERPIENRMLEDNELSRTNVLKVAHHGSRTSSAEPFLDAVHPQFAIIAVGTDNSYGHPNGEVIDCLHDHHAAVFRTDQDGLISIRSDGRRLWLDTNRWERNAPQLLGIFP